MSRYSKLGKVAKCGSPDSKYFGNLEQFEKDLAEKELKSTALKDEVKNTVRGLILQDPIKAKNIYHLVIEELINIKEEYGF